MARIRSPGYPSFALKEVIEFAEKVHKQDRQHLLDRETAARHMGFSGLSGASDRALSALMHYGLAERGSKGEIRIADLTLRIIHPDTEQERIAALYEAGFSPDLFQELRKRYPGAPPSRETLQSYLLRSGFATAAIPPASKAYLETCYFLQQERAYESGGNVSTEAPESPAVETLPEPKPMTHQTQSPSAVQQDAIVAALIDARVSAQTARDPFEELDLNDVRVATRGGLAHIEALLDYAGLAALERKIKGLRAMMEPDASDKPN